MLSKQAEITDNLNIGQLTVNKMVETLEEYNSDLHRDQNLENRSSTAKQLQIVWGLQKWNVKWKNQKEYDHQANKRSAWH